MEQVQRTWIGFMLYKALWKSALHLKFKTKQKALLVQGLLREEEKKGGNWEINWCAMQQV